MRILFISLIVVLVDQITKLMVKGFSIPFLKINFEGMIYGEKHDIIGSFLRLTFVENPGMAFGIDVGISSKLFLSLFSIFASIGIIFYLYKVRNENYVTRLSLALILGGAIGNLIDRMFYGVFYNYAPVFYGRVVDFIDVDFFDISLFGYTYDRWPIFNVADLSVSIGVLLLIFFSKRKETTGEPIKTEEQININESNISTEPPVNLQHEFIPSEVKNKAPETKNDKSDNSKEIQI